MRRHHFQAEAGDALSDASDVVDRRLPAGHSWLWDNEDEPVAMAALSDPVLAVVRVGPVYTPPEHRNCGYASALVATVSSAVRSKGVAFSTPILATRPRTRFTGRSGIEPSPK